MEAVGNVRTVASLGCEKTFHNLYVDELKPHQRVAKRNSYVRALVLSLARSVMFFAFAVCIYYGGYLIHNENMEVEKVFKYVKRLLSLLV